MFPDRDTPDSVIDIRAFSFVYPRASRAAVRDLTCSVPRREILAVLLRALWSAASGESPVPYLVAGIVASAIALVLSARLLEWELLRRP